MDGYGAFFAAERIPPGKSGKKTGTRGREYAQSQSGDSDPDSLDDVFTGRGDVCRAVREII